ncbi:hypothetical protein BDL97_09G009700 [Sphagnum fallax]|nr:hypothetical protein BDL97_09G009700 [Sphagnum fallax]
MGAVKSRSKKREGAASVAARRAVDVGGVAAMGKGGKGRGSNLSVTAVSDTFLPVRIALVCLILFVGVVAAFLYSRGRVSFLSLEKVDKTIHVYGYEIVHEFPHDPAAFTQGLFYDGNETFYESTGLYGKSSVRKVDVTTGKVLQNRWMHNSVFGEGLTLWDSRLLQVSWRTTKGIIYNKSTLTPVGSFDHPMRDGWGLTTDGEHIIGSDGTANLYFMDPSTFKEVRIITVQDEGQPVTGLNELEYIGNEIWSNVFMTECIARISPKDGKVIGWLLMHGLRRSLQDAGFKQSNGIKYPGIRVLSGPLELLSYILKRTNCWCTSACKTED